MTSGFCEQCGAALEGAARFCPACGAALPEAPPAAAPAAPARRRGWPWRRVLLIALPLLGLLTAGAVAAWMLLNDAPEDRAVALVPATADLYATAYLSPSLGQKRSVKEVLDRAREAGASEASTDSIEDLIADLVEDETPLSYSRDVKPQLGDQITVYSMPADEGEDEAAVLVATEDPQASLEAMRRVMKSEYGPDSWRGDDGWRIVQRSHDGQPYEVAIAPDATPREGEFGFTIVDGFVVIAAEPEIVASLDARGGESLGDTERYNGVRDRLSDDVLAFLYADGERVADIWDGYGVQDGMAASDDPVGMTVQAGDGQLAIDVAASSPVDGERPFADASDLMKQLPADAVAAVSFGDVGGLLRAALDEGSNQAAADLQEALDDDTDLDLERDFGSWLGNAGMYMSGSSTDSVEGALVAETRSQADSDHVVDELESLAADSADDSDYYDYDSDYGTSVTASDDGLGFDLYENGETLEVRADGDRLIAGMGAGGLSTDAALDADGGFGDSDAYKTAESTLGGGFEPFLVLDAPPIERLLAEIATDSGDSSYFDDVQPWLTSIETVAGGARGDGGEVELRFVLGLRNDAAAASGQSPLSGE